VGCELTGTPYKVSIQTPSPSCVDCAPARSMLVSIWQPQFGLTFGKILGPDTWTVRSTSVAGMVIAPQYGIVTLRPSALRPNDSDANYKDLAVTGGSKVVVGNADIATNSNATCSGAASGSEIKVDTADGFDIHHFGVGAAWTETPDNCLNPPPGFQVTTLVEVPPYQFPPKPTTPVYTTLAAAIESGAQCDTAQDAIPDTYVELKTLKKINDPLLVDVTCYKPGVYQTKLTVSDPASGLPSVALLRRRYCGRVQRGEDLERHTRPIRHKDL
jgi:hypothetical protein